MIVAVPVEDEAMELNDARGADARLKLRDLKVGWVIRCMSSNNILYVANRNNDTITIYYNANSLEEKGKKINNYDDIILSTAGITDPVAIYVKSQ